MADKVGNQFLVLLKISPCDYERLQVFTPALRELLARISTEPIELFFRSENYDVFGFFIRSKLRAGQILAAVESPQRESWEKGGGKDFPPFLTGEDHVAVIQVGPDHSSRVGFSRALTWMQRH